MGENKTAEIDSQLKKERFEFVLTINDNIACQRYFRINGYRDRSAYSVQLKDTVRYCVDLIKNDLASKSRVFLWYTAPQTFQNVEEMNKWVDEKPFNIPVCSYIILRDSEEVYIWNGESMELYNGYFNRNDYIQDGNEQPCVIKFSFYDDGKEIISEVFDGNQYPRFVRNNIDLSNKNNKYETREFFSPFEATLVKCMNVGHQDLIPIIIRELCVCCSNDNNNFYTTSDRYGDKTYAYNVSRDYTRYVDSLASKCKKKTDRYFGV